MATTARVLFEFANHLEPPNHVFNSLEEVGKPDDASLNKC